MKPKASSIIVINNNKQCLLQLRDSKPGILYPNHWSLIGGNAEGVETPIDTARRECLEETGLQGLIFHYFMQFETPYHLETVFWARYSGPRTGIICCEGVCNEFVDFHQIQKLKMGFNHDVVCALFARYLPEILRENNNGY